MAQHLDDLRLMLCKCKAGWHPVMDAMLPPDQTGGAPHQALQTAHLVLGLAHHIINKLELWKNLPLYFTISV